MVTTEVFENLKSLQEILVQKYELEGKKNDAPKQLSNQEDLLAKTQKEFIELKSNYDATQEKVTQLKTQLDEAVKSREEGEKGVANSTTHREYEALEKQITEAKLLEEQVRKDLQKEEKDLAELNERLKNTDIYKFNCLVIQNIIQISCSLNAELFCDFSQFLRVTSPDNDFIYQFFLTEKLCMFLSKTRSQNCNIHFLNLQEKFKPIAKYLLEQSCGVLSAFWDRILHYFIIA